MIDFGDRVPNHLLDSVGLVFISGQTAGDRSGYELDGHQARLLAGLLPAHAVSHDEQIGRLKGQRRHLAVAFRVIVVPYRTSPGNEEIVFIMLPIVALY